MSAADVMVARSVSARVSVSADDVTVAKALLMRHQVMGIILYYSGK